MELQQIDLFTYGQEIHEENKKVEKEKEIENVKTINKNANLNNRKILKRYKMYRKSRLTKESVKAIIENDLRLFVDFIGEKALDEITHIDIQDFLLYCDEERENGDQALARKFTSLNKFYDTLIRQEIIECKNPLDKLDKPVVRKKQRGHLTYEEYQQILEYLDNIGNLRDAALYAFFFSSGCRLTEVYQQNKDNLDVKNGRFKVLGKGDKERICIFSKGAAERIKRYLDTREDDLEALFVSRQNNRLSKKSIQDAIKRTAKRAGIKMRTSPHILRHTRAMHLLKQGANLETIQRLLGHSNISTTQIYAHLNIDDVQDEVLKIDGDI